MTKQPEALRLADLLESYPSYSFFATSKATATATAAELRRLHEMNAELLEALLNLLNIAEDVRENTRNRIARQFQQMHIDAARTAIAKVEGGE